MSLMYDLDVKFQKFYREEVVLPHSKQQELHEKKKLNLQRLRAGLQEYNRKHKTNYKVAETRVQGSMSMATVVQNDSNDYDIDVAVVFNDVDIDGVGARQARNIVCDALTEKSGQFSLPPQAKTNCVRIQYSNGYHIDFAVYRRSISMSDDNAYMYEHSGGINWVTRDPAAITKWFQERNKASNQKLRQVVRLSKMFCKSRSFWGELPGGLLQSVVCDECLANGYERLDETFYHTMVAVLGRLSVNQSVYNPTAPELSLLTSKNHWDKMERWHRHLGEELGELDILFDNKCSLEEAASAWGRFFNHQFWTDALNESAQITIEGISNDTLNNSYRDTEEFVEERWPINILYDVSIGCEVSAKGFRMMELKKWLRLHNILRNIMPIGLTIEFSCQTDAPKPYDIWWKVRNVGTEAERRDCIRGQIFKGETVRKEHSDFVGTHYVECYIVKNGECVAMNRRYVPIDGSIDNN